MAVRDYYHIPCASRDLEGALEPDFDCVVDIEDVFEDTDVWARRDWSGLNLLT